SEGSDRDQPAPVHGRQSQAGCKLAQCQAMPPERCTLCSGQIAAELVRGAGAGAENHHLFGGGSGFEPRAGAVKPRAAGNRYDNSRCHVARVPRIVPTSARLRITLGFKPGITPATNWRTEFPKDEMAPSLRGGY